jgi:hypothetical protein
MLEKKLKPNLNIALIDGAESDVLKKILICLGHTPVSYALLGDVVPVLSQCQGLGSIHALIINRHLGIDETDTLHTLAEINVLPMLVFGAYACPEHTNITYLSAVPGQASHELITWLNTIDVPEQATDPDDNLYTLIYTSRAEDSTNEFDLMNILTVSRKINKQLNITGVLLYSKWRWLQILEGPFNSVTTLFFDHIKHDKRHTDVTLLVLEPCSKRRFANWNMGYYSTDINVPLNVSFTDMSKHPAGEFICEKLLHHQAIMAEFLST